MRVEGIDKVCVRVAHMDVYVGLSRVSGTMPTYNSTTMRLVNMCHPCVRPPAVPLSVEHARGKTHIMTGSSTSGKTTWMRTCLLASYLHQVGLPLPCESASLPLFDAILMVGTTSNDEWGQSTFMKHVVSLRKVWMSSTGESLIGVDEPCQCTNTREGTELARMFLARVSGTLLVTTHLPLRSSEEYHLKSFQVVDGRDGESGAMRLCVEMGMTEMVRVSESFKENYK